MIEVVRRIFTDLSAVGDLYFAGERLCWTLEDPPLGGPDRPIKIAHLTGIADGDDYGVVIDWSRKFQRPMPHIVTRAGLELASHQGVRFHCGDRPEATDGCVLVGLEHAGRNRIGHCPPAFKLLFERLEAAGAGSGILVPLSIRSERP